MSKWEALEMKDLTRAVVARLRALSSARGQGTVEYVGLILLVSLLMVGMVAAMKGFNRPLIRDQLPRQGQPSIVCSESVSVQSVSARAPKGGTG